MMSLDFAAGLAVLLTLLQGRDLGLGIDPALGCRLRLQGLQALLEGLQVVPEPGAADPGRGDENTALPEFVARPDLAVGRLLQSIIDNRLFDLLVDPVPRVGFPAALCVFRAMSASGSESCRSSIPIDVGPPFRAMSVHDSGACRSIV